MYRQDIKQEPDMWEVVKQFTGEGEKPLCPCGMVATHLEYELLSGDIVNLCDSCFVIEESDKEEVMK